MFDFDPAREQAREEWRNDFMESAGLDPDEASDPAGVAHEAFGAGWEASAGRRGPVIDVGYLSLPAEVQSDLETQEPDSCRSVVVDAGDGPETIRVHGAGPVSAESAAALGDLVAAARRKAAEDCCGDCGHMWLTHGPSGCHARSRSWQGCPCPQRPKAATDD